MRKTVEGLEHVKLRYCFYVLAAGFSVGFVTWAARHEEQLSPFLLTNQLSPDERNTLLIYLAGAMTLAYALWFVAAAVLARATRAESAFTHSAAWFALLMPGFLLPLLLTPGFGDTRRFLTFALVLGVGALLYLGVREVQRTGAELKVGVGKALPMFGKTGRYVALVLVSLLSLGYGVYFSVFTVSEHNTLHTHAFDLGIFDQVMYYLTHEGAARFTVVHNPPESFWSVHFSPALYLLVPFYALYEDARTLLVAQSFLLGAGGVVLYALTLHLTKRTLIALALSASYLLSAALHGVNTFEFHEVALAPLLLLLTLYCLETERLPLFWLFLTLSLLVKEDIPLTGVAIGLYILARGRLVLGLSVVGICAAYFFAVVEVLIPSFGNGNYNLIADRFGDMVAPGSEGIMGVVKTGLTNPLYVIVYIFSNSDKLAYLGYLFVPVLFLPLLAGRAWLIVLPALATALLSSFGGQFILGNQYPAIIIPLLFFLAAVSFREVPRVHHGALVVALLASSLLMNYQYGRVPPADLFTTGQRQVVHSATPHQKTLYRMLEEVPPEVPVAATGTLVPHLSSRPVVQMLPNAGEVEVVLMDLRQGANYWPTSREGTLKQLGTLLRSGDYGVSDYDPACCVLLEHGESKARNVQVLRSLP